MGQTLKSAFQGLTNKSFQLRLTGKILHTNRICNTKAAAMRFWAWAFNNLRGI